MLLLYKWVYEWSRVLLIDQVRLSENKVVNKTIREKCCKLPLVWLGGNNYRDVVLHDSGICYLCMLKSYDQG